MLCSELMKGEVARCSKTWSLVDAARLMRDRDVGFLPVCDEEEIVIGVLTDRDIVVRAVAERLVPARTLVADVMSSGVIVCHPEDAISAAERQMGRFRKSRMVCTDREGHISGIISLSDIAKAEPAGRFGALASLVASRETEEPGFRSARLTLSCRDVMRLGVEWASLQTPIGEVARSMRDRNIGFVPICDEGGSVVGTLTDRDVAVRVVAGGGAPDSIAAGAAMTRPPICCLADDAVELAESRMARHRKSRIVCVDEDLRPMGVISLSDLLRVESTSKVAAVLRGVWS